MHIFACVVTNSCKHAVFYPLREGDAQVPISEMPHSTLNSLSTGCAMYPNFSSSEIRTYVDTYMCVYTHTYIRTYVHTYYIHSYMCIYSVYNM